MTTDVEERTQTEVGSARDDDGLASDRLAEPLPGQVDLVDATDADPGPPEDCLLLEREHVIVDEGARRKRARALERLEHGGELRGRERACTAVHEAEVVSHAVAPETSVCPVDRGW
jgi:hypothetical protein